MQERIAEAKRAFARARRAAQLIAARLWGASRGLCLTVCTNG